MFYKLKQNLKRAQFNQLTAGILYTSPLELKDAPWTIVSMVSNADVQMYLLALKSLYRRLGAGKVTAIIIRQMPVDLQNMLKKHVPGIHLVYIDDIDVGSCHRGGCWERLLFLLDHSEREYAIQLDCDTLAFGPDVSEVRRSIEGNISFTLGNQGQAIVPMSLIATQSQAEKSDQIGIVSERIFDRYPESRNLKYVQASAAFTGFAKGGFTRARMEEFHRNMRDLIGDRWLEWGTEQTASSFAIANSPGSIVLPYPKYSNFGPECIQRGTYNSAFLHFMGTYRFLNMTYADLSKRIINELHALTLSKAV